MGIQKVFPANSLHGEVFFFFFHFPSSSYVSLSLIWGPFRIFLQSYYLLIFLSSFYSFPKLSQSGIFVFLGFFWDNFWGVGILPQFWWTCGFWIFFLPHCGELFLTSFPPIGGGFLLFFASFQYNPYPFY